MSFIGRPLVEPDWEVITKVSYLWMLWGGFMHFACVSDVFLRPNLLVHRLTSYVKITSLATLRKRLDWRFDLRI